MSRINIIGAGLAGCEAALYLANKGFKVKLFEMRPKTQTPAHLTADFAELVCSNSLKSMLTSTASGLLKQEMKMLGCSLLDIALKASVPAGNALAINRKEFSKMVFEAISSNPNIEIIINEVTEITDEPTILATGPLTSNNLIKNLKSYLDEDSLFFFDAIAPIVSADSLDNDIIYRATRYDKGEADYLNCPFTKEEYYTFVDALLEGEKFEAHEFENEFFKEIKKFNFYENCTPVEELARRGVDTLRYGVLRPVGLINPKTGKRPYAVLQLRAENKNNTAYNLVGCQTMLKQAWQKNAFRLIPGLKKTEILRYGAIHRNTYLNTPKECTETLNLKKAPNVYLAGQISGLEGYTESIFGGLLVARIISGKTKILPAETMTGQLWRHLITENKNYQPMNANFGIIPPLDRIIKDKKLKKEEYSKRAIKALESFLN